MTINIGDNRKKVAGIGELGAMISISGFINHLQRGNAVNPL
jgi:hypothetical protein